MRRTRAVVAGLLTSALALGSSVLGVTACGEDLGSASAGVGGEGGGTSGVGQGGVGQGGEGGAVYDGPPLPWAWAPFPDLPADVEPPTEARVALGRALFYDPILSGDSATACLTCHSEQWGLGDGLPTSIGIDGTGPVGPGRVGPTSTRRNAPTLWNVAFRTAYFWDGRATTLEEQALEPLRSAIELGLDPEEAAARLRVIPAYVALFQAAFPDEGGVITPDLIARALAALQRTFVSRRAPYDQYVAGDEGALDDETQRGMRLFGEAGCANCHAPPLFASDRYADRGVDSDDPGRFEVSGEAADVRTFRVPTLRNLRDTEPYFHDGSVASLEDAVAVEVAEQIASGASRALSEDEVAAIARFLNKALQDTSAAPDRPRDVPSGLSIPEDGFRIPR